jgi:hypothetical protein
LTVKQFLNDRLAAWEAAKRITPRSVERYRELIDNQIVPHLGAKLLQSLKPIDIEDWHAKLISSGRLTVTPLNRPRSPLADSDAQGGAAVRPRRQKCSGW